MTPEHALDNWATACQQIAILDGGQMKFDEVTRQAFLDTITQVNRLARREAFERACKAQCRICREDDSVQREPVVWDEGERAFIHTPDVLPRRCEATPTRALMDEESTGKEPSNGR